MINKLNSGKAFKKVLLIQVPGSAGKSVFAPVGLLAVGKILRAHGIEIKIVDLCIDNDILKLIQIAQEIKPCLIGFGGIASSYSATKDISKILHKYCPDSVYIAGGPLSSTYDILLEDRAVGYVFHGEVEQSLPKFISFAKEGASLSAIGGISFLSEKAKTTEDNGNFARFMRHDNLITRTHPFKEPVDLSTNGYPEYGLIDMNPYTLDLRDWHAIYRPQIDKISTLKNRIKGLMEGGKYRYTESIVTSRGCTHKCQFCYRHVPGIRRYSIEYVLENIRLLKKHCAIDGVSFSDELFNSDRRYVYELCDALKSADLGLSFYMACGVRADNIDEDMIRRLSEAGFINLLFGQESGSETVLKYYRKGISAQQNIDSVLLTEKYAMHTCVQLVIGSPVETTKTILETRDFLRAVDARQASINYIIPLPETPMWEQVKNAGYIKDIRKYLERVRRYAGSYRLGLNLSKANKLVWIFWYIFLERAVFLNRYKNSLLKKIYYGTYFFKVSSLIKRRLFRKTGVRL